MPQNKVAPQNSVNAPPERADSTPPPESPTPLQIEDCESGSGSAKHESTKSLSEYVAASVRALGGDVREPQFVTNGSNSSIDTANRDTESGISEADAVEVNVLFPSESITEVNWRDTFGVYHWGENFPSIDKCIIIYVIFLVLGCIGGLLILLSSCEFIAWYHSISAVVLVTPHMVFDYLIWQRSLAKKLARHDALLAPTINNIFFLVLLVALAVIQDYQRATTTLCFAVVMVASNTCVMFYDAIHPSISKKAVIFALLLLFSVYCVTILAVYGNYMIKSDIEFNFLGEFSVNAKSLLFGCLQNMIVEVMVQAMNRFYYPTNLLALDSKMELRTMTKGVYTSFQQSTSRTRRMSVATISKVAARKRKTAQKVKSAPM